MGTYKEILDAAWADATAPRKPNAPTVITMFAGCGGSSLGYRMAGYRELVAAECNALAADTFALNFPDCKLIHRNIASIEASDLLDLAELQLNELDVLSGALPYQGADTLQTFDDDEQWNSLFIEFTRLLQGLRPRAFMMESMVGMVKGNMRSVFAAALTKLELCGYEVRCRKLNAANYGVPQVRECLVFLGVRKGIGQAPTYPVPSIRAVTARDALEDLPDDPSYQVSDAKLSGIVRVSPLRPAPATLKRLLHWKHTRQLNQDELKQIVSFPTAFKGFPQEVAKEKWALLGRAVPPLMVRAVAEVLFQTLDAAPRNARRVKVVQDYSNRRVDEGQMLKMVDAARNVILIEPVYQRNQKRNYPPLGLAKLATRAKANGAKVRYRRGPDGKPFDLACVTSLFTVDSAATLGAVRAMEEASGGASVLAGGVMASLMPERFERNTGAYIFEGYSKKLDALKPDLAAVSKDIEERWNSFSYVFTSRGCPNSCEYCAVKTLEPECWINPNWRDYILADRPNVMISDNNLTASPRRHFLGVIDFLAKSGKGVTIDSGVDCKFITEKAAAQFARLKYVRYGMRMAFDRIEEDGIFQRAVVRLVSAGVPNAQIMAFVLFNFEDTPKEANYRMTECVRLGVRPYPQLYQPLNRVSRVPMYISPTWTLSLIRAFRGYWLAPWQAESCEEYLRVNMNRSPLAEKDWAAWNAPFRGGKKPRKSGARRLGSGSGAKPVRKVKAVKKAKRRKR